MSMQVAHDFNRDETLSFVNTEQMINFIVDNYLELMSVYRVMKKTNLTIRADKEAAHVNLNALRNMKDQTDPATLSNSQKVQIAAKEKHLKKVREEDRVHYYNGEKLEQNQITLLILNHPILMAVLDRFDTFGRVVLAGYTKKAVRLLVTPLIKSAEVIRKDTSMPHMARFTQKVQDFADQLPGLFEETIMDSLDPDLDWHHDGWDDFDDDDDEDGWQVFEISL